MAEPPLNEKSCETPYLGSLCHSTSSTIKTTLDIFVFIRCQWTQPASFYSIVALQEGIVGLLWTSSETSIQRPIKSSITETRKQISSILVRFDPFSMHYIYIWCLAVKFLSHKHFFYSLWHRSSSTRVSTNVFPGNSSLVSL